MNLVIVESPTKSKKISQFLGKDYLVLSSMGHVYDLPKSALGVDVEHDFKPEYQVVRGRKKVLGEITKAAQKADETFLATDLDREGEAIAWHVAAAIQGVDPNDKVDSSKLHRVVFHEITKEAILAAFTEARSLDLDLFNAQKARRILDRLVGYKLSPLLWKKIRYGLSAGRVQSVGVRLIVERERERENFSEDQYFRIWAELITAVSGGGDLFKAELVAKDDVAYETRKKQKLFASDYTVTRTSIASEKEAQDIIEDIKGYEFSVQTVEKKEVKQNPSPPYTTAAMQRAAANLLGFSARQTMSLAQRMYEEGFITYHRTDSTALAEQFINKARDYLEKSLGKQFVPESAARYQTSRKSAQEAHEAIRPTKAEDLKVLKGQITRKLGENEARLFELIWRQAIACQSVPALYERLSIEITAGPYLFRAQGSILKFSGWKELGGPSNQNNNDALLPGVQEKEKLELKELSSTDHTTSAPPRYTEASLVKDLEKHEIGRPSTYAAVISTIQDRNYVGQEDRYFYPQDTGIVVNDLLVEHFPDIVDLKFTAEMEEDLDRVARGEKKWTPLLKEFYGPFQVLLERKMKEIKKEDIVVMGKTGRKCPECGNELVIKLGKFGRFISCANFPKCEYAEFLDDKRTPEDEGQVDEDQLKGKCPDCDSELELKQGRYGRFIACNGYPKCKYTKNYLEKIGMKCPECKDGEVIIKRTRKGRVFYGCSHYPKCKYAAWKNPVLSL